MALAKAISDAGHKAVHVAQALKLDAEDTEIWELAKRNSLIIISKDEDFAKCSKQIIDSPVVVWVRVGNISNKKLLKWFEKLLPQIIELIELGDTLIEIR